ncbi:FecR family protein [Echinicola shivajiensis]|uniref:FecR family protein n=1 Tax=Echinicola shivajiensis TaxID=1035916 RepID=UPI001BFCBF92|nr:FecR domain-containing protein [Echinicola shivajiensis]
MQSYSKIEDLLFDQSFKDWVLADEPVEDLHWPNWIASSDENYRLYGQAKAILISLNNQGKDLDDSTQRKLFDRIEQSIQSKGKNRTSYSSAKRSISNRSWFRAAAILVFVLVASIAFLNIIPYQKEVQLLTEDYPRVIKSNPIGQKSKLYLPDGTTVYLNAESEISFQENFGKDHRDIDLKGEAFFEVAHDTLLPFRVKSRDMVTVALGTSFNINAYQENMPSVQLATGKVRVYSVNEEKEEIFLNPGEAAVLEKSGLNKSSYKPLYAFGWKSGVLSFAQMKFTDVKLKLERWYGVEITVENLPHKDEKVSGEFNDATLDNVLKSLGYTLGFNYRIDHKKITIKFKARANE